MNLLSVNCYFIFENGIDRAVIRAHEALLDIRAGDPILHIVTAQDIIDATSEVPGAAVLLRVPARKHALPCGVEESTEIPKHRFLSSLVTWSLDMSFKHQLVE